MKHADGAKQILITCPPMLGMMEAFTPRFQRAGVAVSCPQVIQTLSVAELLALVPEHDGWIIGDDPATREVFAAGRGGRLRAAVKWGVGVDNIDFEGAKAAQVAVTNTPAMFGAEVADVATGYVIGLARELFWIDRQVKAGGWPKPCGISLQAKKVALVGYGDIGQHTAKRLTALGLELCLYDPALKGQDVEFPMAKWPHGLEEADFVVFTCALTPANRHMFNRHTLDQIKPGVRIVNVSRGPLIEEAALVEGLENGQVHAAALDVFEHEPLPQESRLREYERCIFGTHNGSNTKEAVQRASQEAISRLFGFLGIAEGTEHRT